MEQDKYFKNVSPKKNKDRTFVRMDRITLKNLMKIKTKYNFRSCSAVVEFMIDNNRRCKNRTK